MIAGGSEQLTLRAAARLGDACNVTGEPRMVQHKLNVLRAHCDAEERDYGAIEKTNMVSFLLARDDAGLATKRERLSMGGPMHSFFLHGFAGRRCRRSVSRRWRTVADQCRPT
jgi:alkanesulfonate monooxygenase SsuD/methylene tetrahydromethanopterin reductase-like flavin-dependent oxidoreductase (luciferase family)